jgi:small conductance mechanosensitive channel
MENWLSHVNWGTVSTAVVLLLVGFVLAKLVANSLYRVGSKRTSKQQARVFQRLVFYSIWLLFIVMALQQFGFRLSVLLGAAGILSVAIGFAAKNAMSNLVSGIFLLIERPFRVGHHIKLNNVEGRVSAIDLLSTKVTTFDNLLIRIPNETVLTATITNLTHYGRRRLDLTISVAYGSDIVEVKTLLLRLAQEHSQILEDPAPGIIFLQFAAASLDLRLSVWVDEINFGNVKSNLQESINEAFNRAGIEIPYPQLTVHTKD